MKKKLGLNQPEVISLQRKYGSNELVHKAKHSSWQLLLAQLRSPLIYILLIAAIITIFLEDFTDTVVILAAVMLNTTLGFFQENKAQQTLESLNQMLAPKAKVLRDGVRKIITASKLVPGDLVILEIGTRVPADGIIVKQDSLTINEAILTGESKPVEKKASKITNAKKLSDTYQAYMGTMVTSGIGQMIVAAIGQKTKMGQIASTLKATKEPKTPLQKKLDEISKFLALFVAAAGMIVFIIGMLLGHSFVEMFTTSVALAVASIPEGLAVSLTVILAVGMQRILRQKAVVRKLVAAETLGGVEVICTDKTGTLTEGKMQVVGSDFIDEKLGLLSTVLCNDQRDPLEISMLDWAQKHPNYSQNLINAYIRLDEIPFNPDYKYIATLDQDKSKKTLFVSGAPEILLAASKLSIKAKKEWQEKFAKAGSKGLRLVSFAYKPNFGQKTIKKSDIKDLIFLGVLYFEDPVRESVKAALKQCRRAGIEVKVITGDYKKTAVAILEKLELLNSDNKQMVIEGTELAQLKGQDKISQVNKAILFSRVTPWQKLEIVEILQKQGQVVAMTGDGVNDAPAIKKADIGIVVDTASDVSKQTADMVLLDSNFNTIVHAVEEGRGIFYNIRKVILYLLCDAFGEVILVIGSLIMKVPLAITASQILWVNLVSDGFPSLALTVEPKDSGLMDYPPRSPKEPVIDTEIKFLIALISSMAGILTFGLYLYYLYILKHPSLELARSVAFASLGINSLLYVFSCRNLKKPIWKENQLKNHWLIAAVLGALLLQLVAIYFPPLSHFLHTVKLSWEDWQLILLTNFMVIIAIEVTKHFFNEKTKQKN